MSQSFLTSLREALECAFLLALLIGYLGGRPGRSEGRRASYALLAGVALAFFAGFTLSYVPGASHYIWANETWVSMRYIFELSVFYLGLVFVIVRSTPPFYVPGVALFALGFFIYFFEARALGFLVHDVGLMKEDVVGSAAMALGGTALGFAPLILLRGRIERIPFQKVFTLPGLLISLGAFQFALGGVGEVEEGSIVAALQGGVQGFLMGAVEHLQGTLLLSGHRFMDVPLTALAAFLAGESMAMAVVVLLITAPPVYYLINLFSRPDPEVGDIKVAAERRLKIAFFRRELIYRSAPVLIAFLLIFITMHAATVAMNPLSEPVPIPLRQSDEEPDVLSVALIDRLGDFTDEKLRKYVYYYGEKRILFIAIMKPDGTVGVALDECEICKPAEWNKAAQGYAQRGGHLVCKYCMTPIPISTVNKPGGCNPIPIPFELRERNVIITLEDLIRVYKEAKALQKKGTHL
jgi:uncharacterized membrane protein